MHQRPNSSSQVSRRGVLHVASAGVAATALAGTAVKAVAMPFAKHLLLFTAVVEYAKPPAAWYVLTRWEW